MPNKTSLTTLSCLRGFLLRNFSCVSLQPRGLQPSRFLCPWDSLGKNTGGVTWDHLQEIFSTQGWNCVSCSSCIAGRFFTTEPPGKLLHTGWERYKNSQKERRELRWSLGQTQCSRGQAGAWNPFALFLTRQKWCLPAQPEPSVVLMGIQQTVALQIKVPLLADSDLGHSPTTSTPHPHCPRQ